MDVSICLMQVPRLGSGWRREGALVACLVLFGCYRAGKKCEINILNELCVYGKGFGWNVFMFLVVPSVKNLRRSEAPVTK